MAVLDAIATAYLDRERARLGLPSRRELEEKRALEARAAAESASRLESADLLRQKTQAEIAALPAEQEQRRRLVEAQIGNYNEVTPPRNPPAPHYVTDAKGNVRAITMGEQGFDVRDLGAIGTPQRDTGAGGRLSPAIESNIINRLTTQWDKANSTINDLKRQRDLMHTGLDAARKGDMAAGSQAVLVTFQKILDPTSVVRESEYARSAAGQALASRIQGAFERIRSGGAGVPVSELEAFAALADQFVENATNSANVNTIRGRVAATADRYGIPHDVIFGVEQPAGPPPAMLAPGAQPVPETWIEVAPGIRKKVRK